MSETEKYDLTIYEGTAWYYSRFRPKYPPSLVSLLRENFRLDGTGRLLDLGCGPGPVAIALAHLFEEVVAMDPDDGMRAEGERIADERGINNIEWRFGGSKDLSPELGQFRLVTMGNSFHWMDRARTLEALYDLVTDGGGIAVVGEGAPIPPPPPTRWRVAINTVLTRYLPDRRLAWEIFGTAARGASRGIHRAFALQRSRQLRRILRRRMDRRLDDWKSLIRCRSAAGECSAIASTRSSATCAPRFLPSSPPAFSRENLLSFSRTWRGSAEPQ